jgi:hypothetical protein
MWTSRTQIYSSSPPFLERLLLRDERRLGAAFLLLRLRDLPRRFADFLLGAAFLRDARRLFGAMVNFCVPLLCGRHHHQRTTQTLEHAPSLNPCNTMQPAT